MDKHFFKKPPLSDPHAQQKFIQETDNAKELLQKELTINRAEQNLLGKRIQMMKEFLNELPTSDPQYNVLAAQIQMDQIELDELKLRQGALEERFRE